MGIDEVGIDKVGIDKMAENKANTRLLVEMKQEWGEKR